MRLIRNLTDFNTANRIVYDRYCQFGYIKDNALQYRYFLRDFLESTSIFVAELNGEIVGTATAYRWSTARLPAYSIFPKEVAELAQSNTTLIEGSRFAREISSPEKQTKNEKIGLFRKSVIKLMYELCCKLNFSDWIVIVNPKTLDFYTSEFGFEQISEVQSCPHVEDNPGVLLKLPVKKIAQRTIALSETAYDTFIDTKIEVDWNSSFSWKDDEVLTLIKKQPAILFEASQYEKLSFLNQYPQLSNEIRYLETHLNQKEPQLY